jgi:hypothetical protein
MIISTQIPKKIFQGLEIETYNQTTKYTVSRLYIQFSQVSLKKLEVHKFQFCLNMPKIQ